MNSQLDFDDILKRISECATSGWAQNQILLLKAQKSQALAEAAMDEKLEASQMLSAGLRPSMSSLDMFETWHSRLKKNAILKPIEVRDVRLFCVDTLAFSEACGSMDSTWAKRLKAKLLNASEPLSAIDQILTLSGEIRSDASETLFRLIREKENLQKQIQSTLDRLIKDHDIDNHLQDKYVTTREGRWVLPIRSGMKPFFAGVTHGSSQTKQTVYMEPNAVVPLNSRMKQIEFEIDEEIERILISLSQYLHGLTYQFQDTAFALREADQTLACAEFATKTKANRVQFSEDVINLFEVYHPLMVINKKEPVKNNVHLHNKKSILLLSGPNAGGKTVLLKSIGLAAQMAQCGLLVCAREDSSLPFFKNIVSVLGDQQAIESDLSTFASHLKNLNRASDLKGSETLLLVDEICGATDPEEGAALARAFIERFAANHLSCVITSHLSPLKAGWDETTSVLNGSLAYDSKTSKPTYQYVHGVPGDSMALQMAERVGVDLSIIERSKTFLSPETKARLSGLKELENIKKDSLQLQEHLSKEIKKAQAEKEKYEALREQFERDRKKQLEKIVKVAEKKIEEKIETTKAVQIFKRHTQLQEIKQTLPEIIKAPTAGSTPNQPRTADEFESLYPIGSKVFVPKLNCDGIIQSKVNKHGELTVLANSFQVSVEWKSLGPPQKQKQNSQDLARKAGAFSLGLDQGDRTLDFRGKTTEEALGELEIQLDQAALRKEPRIKVIHGHGSDTLKRSIRGYLSRSVYVKKWMAGTKETGGDGITWIEIED